MTKHGATLLFLESHEQVSKVRRLLRSYGASAKVVALSPEAMDALDEVDQPYVILENYYPLESLRNIGEAGFALTERLFDEIDRDVRHSLGETADYPASGLARMWFSDLKTMVDAVSTRAFGIRRVLEEEMPESVLFFQTRTQRLNDILDFDRESVYSLVLPIVCESLGMPFTSLGTSRLSLARRNFVLWKRFIFALVGKEKAGRAKLMLSTWRSRLQGSKRVHGRPKVLLLFATPELLDVVRTCREAEQYDFVQWLTLIDFKFSDLFPPRGGGARASSRILEEFARDMEALWGDERVREKLLVHFIFDGLDCRPVVETRMKHLITRSLPTTLGTWLRARALLQSSQFASVLASTFTSAQERAVASAARDMGVPVILYQHGGATGWRPLPTLPHEEGEFADHFMAYGEGSAEHFANTTPPGSHQPQTFPTGSCSLDRLAETLGSKKAKDKVCQKHRLDPQKKVLLYVVDYLGGNRSHFPCYYPDTWYYAQQKAMIRVLAAHPEFQCLVKLGPGHTHNPLADYVRRLGVNHIKVMSSGRFLDLLPAADAVFIDYASTPVIESLVTGKPVIVLIDRRLLIFDEDAMTMLGRRASVANDPAAFLQMVERFLDEGAPESDVIAEKEFQRRYGTHLGDGQSLQRVLAYIQSVTDSARPLALGISTSTHQAGRNTLDRLDQESDKATTGD